MIKLEWDELRGKKRMLTHFRSLLPEEMPITKQGVAPATCVGTCFPSVQTN